MATGTATLTADPLVEPAAPGLTRAGAARDDAIDLLRGLVIAIMVLDHVRDFVHVSANSFDPTDPVRSYPLLYLTRWVTHLCAPTFVLLAGVSIYFQKAGGKAPAELSRYLLTRGAWLVLLELTLISFGFNFAWPFFFLQVIWAIGVSMILMAAVARLSAPAVLALGAAILLLYPLAAAVSAGATGSLATLRMLALGFGLVEGAPIFAAYAILPWFAVMCLGFGLGPIFRLPPAQRRRAIAAIACGLLATYLVLRFANGYGDPVPWSAQAEATRTAMSFFSLSKYPPSPLYLCATLGLALLVFLALEPLRGPLARILGDFGRTPLFTYLCHLYIAHGLALAAALALGRPGDTINMLGQAFAGYRFPGWGWELGAVYALWLVVLALLVPLSRWMAGLKRRRRDWWLGYV